MQTQPRRKRSERRLSQKAQTEERNKKLNSTNFSSRNDGPLKTDVRSIYSMKYEREIFGSVGRSVKKEAQTVKRKRQSAVTSPRTEVDSRFKQNFGYRAHRDEIQQKINANNFQTPNPRGQKLQNKPKSVDMTAKSADRRSEKAVSVNLLAQATDQFY